MTALTMPARPDEDDAGLRPVPWRRMAGVAWRQHRIALGGVAVLLGALAVYLWIAGLPLHHAYAAAVACQPASSAACQGLDSTLDGMDNFLSNGFILQVLPVLIGAFAGAPVLARELETGTFRYAWTQGFGRRRWAVAKLALLAVVVTAAAAAFGALLTWYYQPFVGNQSLGLPRTTPLTPGLFDLRGVGFPAWTLAAFAIGALAGMLIRRVVPAIVAILVVYAGLAFATGGVPARALPGPAGHLQQLQPARHRVDHQPVIGQGRQVRVRRLSSHEPPQPVLLFPSTGAGQAFGGNIRAVPRPARVHAVDELPVGQPVLALPVDRGRLAARAVGAAHRRNGLAGPPPRRLMHPAMRPRGVTPPAVSKPAVRSHAT